MRELLDKHGLADVGVQEVRGTLSDQYDLRTRTIRLSRAHYRSASIAALGIAAHEIGHAQQHMEKNRWMALRLVSWLIRIAGWAAVSAFSLVFVGLLSFWGEMVTAGLFLFAGGVLLSLLTLPVELNASRRAMAMLSAGGYMTDTEMEGVKAVLHAAAWGYVATAGTALVQAIRDFVKRDDDWS